VAESQLEWRRHSAEASGGTSSDEIAAAIRRKIMERDLRGTILDYGAGAGRLTDSLLEMGRFERVVAADIMPVPQALASRIEWIEQDLNLPIRSHDGVFDAIVASEVIEHLENPRAVMRDLYRMLRPGGTVIVTTPNNESWRSLLALAVRGHFVAFGDSNYPAHIVALVRADIERILRETGFSSAEFSYTNDGGIPCKPNVKWQKISFGLLGGRRFSDNLLAIASKPN
jgi:2-polyprenyl-3-methyl-5-hydroxy-6-metoxy-1,4-benzoquinol methylase